MNVICELARKNPKNYLSLAPIFFKLMTTSTNNWMLIKIIKLVGPTIPPFSSIDFFFRSKYFTLNQFGRFTMIEPELGRRLAEPIIDIITRFNTNMFYELMFVVDSLSAKLVRHSLQLAIRQYHHFMIDFNFNLIHCFLLFCSLVH